MDQEIAKLEASLAEAREKAEEAGGADDALNQAAQDAEKALAEAKAKSQAPSHSMETSKETSKKFTRKERLEFEKRKIEEQLREEYGEDENRPLTLREFKRLEAEKARKTALEMAEMIEDKIEKEQVKDILLNRITPSGNAEQDFALARGAVNGLKNAQIAEEALRISEARRFPSVTGSPGKTEEQFNPTDEERVYMGPPYNLTKEEILAARQRAKEKYETGIA